MSKENKDPFRNMPLGKLCSMITKPYFGALVLKTKGLKIEKHYSVLILLEENTKCTQQYIADTLQIDKVTMVKIIDEFAKKGLVMRIQNPKDRREHFVELTSKGYKMLPAIHRAIEAVNETAFKNFKPKERKLFLKYIIQVCKNVEKLPSAHVIVYKTRKVNHEK